MIYFFLIMFVYAFLYLSRNCKRKNLSNIFIFFAILLMTLVAGCRWFVGTDFEMYNLFYYSIKAKGEFVFSLSLEPMFIAFCYITGKFFDTSFVCFLLIALYTYTFIVFACKKCCKYYDFAVFLYFCFGFYFSSLNIVRQWMAIAPILYYYATYENNSKIKNSLLLLLCILSHYSSIIIIPLIFLCKCIKKESTRLGIILVSLLLYALKDNVLLVLKNICLSFDFLSKYAHYFNGNNYSNASLMWPLVFFSIYIFYLIFYCLPKKRENSLNNIKINFCTNILTLAIVFAFWGRDLDLMERLSHYFLVVVVLLIPLLYQNIINKENKKFLFITISIGCLLLLINVMKNNGGDFLPYKIRELNIPESKEVILNEVKCYSTYL